MPSTAKKASSKAAEHKEATAILRADHKLVSKLFADYEKAESSEAKKALADEICMELTIHAQVEEEIFYPAFKEALGDSELVPEAIVEHATLKKLIAEVQTAGLEQEMFDARIKVMGEYVKRHVKEEQDEIFPKARESKDLDMVELGAQIMQRKEELMAERSAQAAG